jgi:hypothetical protein
VRYSLDKTQRWLLGQEYLLSNLATPRAGPSVKAPPFSKCLRKNNSSKLCGNRYGYTQRLLYERKRKRLIPTRRQSLVSPRLGLRTPTLPAMQVVWVHVPSDLAWKVMTGLKGWLRLLRGRRNSSRRASRCRTLKESAGKRSCFVRVNRTIPEGRAGIQYKQGGAQSQRYKKG